MFLKLYSNLDNSSTFQYFEYEIPFLLSRILFKIIYIKIEKVIEKIMIQKFCETAIRTCILLIKVTISLNEIKLIMKPCNNT